MKIPANSGSWCWFTYPRAIRFKGKKDQTFFGYVTGSGEIIIQSYDHDQFVSDTFNLGKHEIDDHNNPSVNMFKYGELFVSYARHNQDNLIRYRKSRTGYIADLGEEKTLQSPRGVTSYSQVHLLGDIVFMLYRVAPRKPKDKPRYWVYRLSNDRGETWGNEKVLFDFGEGEQGYIVSSQRIDSPQTVDIVLSGHPAHGYKHDVNYCCVQLDSGNINIPGGGRLGNVFNASPSLAMEDTFTVYNYRDNNDEKAWIWDVYTVGDDPRVLFTTYPSGGSHVYKYAHFNRSTQKFDVKQITTTTGSIADERELYYSGGMGFVKSGDVIDRLFLAEKVNGRWEIFKYITSDKGNSWLKAPITSASYFNNYRPIPVINYHKNMEVLWLNGDYTFYKNYNTEIVCLNPAKRS